MVHLSFWKHWVSRMSVRGKELICMQMGMESLREPAVGRGQWTPLSRLTLQKEGCGLAPVHPGRCDAETGAGALVAGQALCLWRPLFSLSPLFFWESSGWRQAHSRRLIWKYLEKQDESSGVRPLSESTLFSRQQVTPLFPLSLWCPMWHRIHWTRAQECSHSCLLSHNSLWGVSFFLFNCSPGDWGLTKGQNFMAILKDRF